MISMVTSRTISLSSTLPSAEIGPMPCGLVMVLVHQRQLPVRITWRVTRGLSPISKFAFLIPGCFECDREQETDDVEIGIG